MQTISLTNKQARRFLLSHQGLGSSRIFEGKKGVLDYISRVGCIQFDPLNIVSRNAELVLQSRIPEFRASMLEELLYTDRMLVDGMDKVMSIYHKEDWPYFHRFRETARTNYESIQQFDSVIPQVRDALEARGPLSSSDLGFNQSVDWAWGPTRVSRAVLESMYLWGELIVHRKKNNQKVYDFAHRHLALNLLQSKDPNETMEQYLDWRVLRRIGAVGFLWDKSGDAWIGIFDLKAKDRQASFQRLWNSGQITRLLVEGCQIPVYARTGDINRVLEVLDSPIGKPRAVILAPLDNFLWDRRMIKAIFGFEYTWEVYKPVTIRNYGYYVLPVLYGDRFVARFEPGRDKKSGVVQIKNWWWEHDVTRSEELMSELQRCFHEFMLFLGAYSIQIEQGLAQREGIEKLLMS